MNRFCAGFAAGLAVAVLVGLAIFTVPETMRLVSKITDKIADTKGGVTIEAPAGKREVVEKNDCSRVVAVRTFEKEPGSSGMWYENHMVLADGRRVVDNGLFIKQKGDLFCHFWTEYVN